METIITSQCLECENGTLDKTDKAKPKVLCALKDKTYYYGQCIACDDFTKRKDTGR